MKIIVYSDSRAVLITIIGWVFDIVHTFGYESAGHVLELLCGDNNDFDRFCLTDCNKHCLAVDDESLKLFYNSYYKGYGCITTNSDNYEINRICIGDCKNTDARKYWNRQWLNELVLEFNEEL